ncbi:MAG TPA: glucoamylase family protein, partial [Tepidisphaeraceae bacterium]|nr:glucoamylase family protein [Tepidisphaeraceae bacterium]
SPPASISATGCYLTLLPELVRRRLINSGDAADRARTTIAFVEDHVDHVHGFLPHFLDIGSGARWGSSEFAVLDTSIFLHGCIVAAQAYPAARDAANRLIDRVGWPKLWAFSPKWRRRLLSYGFSGKDRSLLPSAADVRSSENLMPCLLAAGSRTHPVGRECWYHTRIVRWKAGDERAAIRAGNASDYERLRSSVLNPGHPLFTSQYGLVWANLRGLHDADGIDLWANARDAAVLNRAFCREIASKSSPTYRESSGGWWGISAGDSPSGYVAPGPLRGDANGTVWPTVALASAPWIDDVIGPDVERWASSPWWLRVRGKYGLSPFSASQEWVGNDLIGIDLGCFAATWANAQHGTIHKLWNAHPVARKGLEQLEFSSS